MDKLKREKKMKREEDIFKKRKKEKLMILFWFAVIYTVSSAVSGFGNIFSFLSIPSGIIWLLKNFIPTADSVAYLPKILKTAFETLTIGITATVLSSMLALITAVIGSETTGISRPAKLAVKIVASFFRNMPLLSWSTVLLFSFKQSQLTGLLALFFITFGYLTRTFMETIDESSQDVIEALEVTGAGYFQIIFRGVIPNISSQLISWILYFVENSIREVTLIGILTGTGIGNIFGIYYRSMRYDVAGLIILVVVILVTGIELLSNKIRKNLLFSEEKISAGRGMERGRNGKIRIRKITKQNLYLYGSWIFLILVTLFTVSHLKIEDLSIRIAVSDFFNNLKVMFFNARLSDNYTFAAVLESLGVTISLAVITTLCGSVIALFLSFFAARNLSSERVSKSIRIFMSFIRSVPTILWVMVFSVVANIGVEAAILGMVFHSVAYLVKAYSESLEEMDRGTVEALKATGASWWQIIFQGVLPSQLTSILSWTFVRFEINFTNAVLVGAAAGAGGIGYEMFMAGTMYFDMKEIGFFTYLIFAVTLTLEYISKKLRTKYMGK